MRLRKAVLHKRILFGNLVLSYVFGIVFGSFAHNIIHHFTDNKHHHSLPCLTDGMTESPSDDSLLLSRGPTFAVKDCDFKLALHNLCRLTTGARDAISFDAFMLIESVVALDTSTVWLKEFLTSSASSRGPPFVEKTLI